MTSRFPIKARLHSNEITILVCTFVEPRHSHRAYTNPQ